MGFPILTFLRIFRQISSPENSKFLKLLEIKNFDQFCRYMIILKPMAMQNIRYLEKKNSIFSDRIFQIKNENHRYLAR